jgi:hypothetical protein
MPHRKRTKDEIVGAIRRLEANRDNLELALKALRTAYLEIDQGTKPGLASKYSRSHTGTGTYRRLHALDPSANDDRGGVVGEDEPPPTPKSS